MTTDQLPSPRWSTMTKLVVTIAVLVVIGWVLIRFQVLITPLLASAMLAYLLNRLITMIAARLKWGRVAAAAVVYLVLLLIVAGLATGLGIYAVNQLANLNVNVQQIVVELPGRIDQLTRSQIEFLGFTINLSQFDLSVLYSQVVAALQPVLSRIGQYVGQAVTSTAEFFGWALFVLVISFYMVKDMPNIRPMIGRYAAGPGYHHDVERLIDELAKIWNDFLRGQALLGLVIGIVSWIGLTVMGVRYAVALGLLSGLLELVPTIGPLISGIVAVAVALFQDSNWLGLSPLAFAAVVAVFFIVVQQLENNILVPRIIGDTLNLHPVVIMVGAIMGASLGGIIGVLLAAPVMATLKLAGGYAWRKMLDLPPFPPPGGKPPEKKPALSLPKFDVRAFFKRSKSGSTTNDKQQ
ncbi:MAG: AI-2E family transporter [Chloroflexota bacterium]